MMRDKVMRKLWCTAKEYGLDEDMVYQLVFDEYGLEHISAMTDNEAYYIIDRIAGKRAVKPSPPGMATAGQKMLIRHLERELGWGENPTRLAGFIKKYSGTDCIDWLTKSQAGAVIEGLKGVMSRV